MYREICLSCKDSGLVRANTKGPETSGSKPCSEHGSPYSALLLDLGGSFGWRDCNMAMRSVSIRGL